MAWKHPLFDQIKKFQDTQEQIKQAQDAFMRALGFVWVKDEPKEQPKPPIEQKPTIKARKPETRKEMVERLWITRGGSKAALYKEAKVDKSLYYKWERGQLPDGCAEDLRIRDRLKWFDPTEA